MTDIALVPGTGTEIVIEIVESLGANVQVIRNLHQAKRASFDGLLLLGGTDISPKFYGQDGMFSYPPDRKRDATEWWLLRRAMNENLPTFGICRGHQFLAIAHGGSLYQDIKAEGATGYHASNHKIVKVHKKLAQHIPTRRVNSYHHQAIRATPWGFEPMAYAPDGVIESIWRPGALGVQWHPELLYPYNNRWSSLFAWFLDGLK